MWQYVATSYAALTKKPELPKHDFFLVMCRRLFWRSFAKLHLVDSYKGQKVEHAFVEQVNVDVCQVPIIGKAVPR